MLPVCVDDSLCDCCGLLNPSQSKSTPLRQAAASEFACRSRWKAKKRKNYIIAHIKPFFWKVPQGPSYTIHGMVKCSKSIRSQILNWSFN